jgi:hypothetical protein
MPRRTDRQTYFRSKSVVLTQRDELAYSRVLREFDPDVQFYCYTYRPSEGNCTLAPTLAHGDRDECWIEVCDPEEKLRMRLYDELGLQDVRTDRVSLKLRKSYWNWVDPTKKWAFDPPLLDWGEVSVGYPAGNEELKKFAGKLLRLVGKITWKRGPYGLDACRWSQTGGKERRGLGSGELIDPSEEIGLNKYYNDELWDDEGLPDESTGVSACVNGRRIRS